MNGRPGAAVAAGTADLDQARVDEFDRDDMLGAIAALPRQLTAGYAAAAATLERLPGPSRPAAVVVCGMGGSGIGGDLALAALPELPVPALVVRGYRLPVWTGRDTLVIAVSYSGDTEETLACAEQALDAGAALTCVASGGRLASLAEAHGVTLLRVPGGGQPRAAVGYLAAPLLATLARAGLCGGGEEHVAEAAALLRDGNAALAADVPEHANAAKRLARQSLQAAGRGVRRRPHRPGGPPLEGPDQRERQGAGLLQRAAGAGPQRADGLDEPAPRHGRQPRRLPGGRARGRAPAAPRASSRPAASRSAASRWNG